MLKVEEGGILSFYASLFHKLVIGNVGKALIASAYASIQLPPLTRAYISLNLLA